MIDDLHCVIHRQPGTDIVYLHRIVANGEPQWTLRQKHAGKYSYTTARQMVRHLRDMFPDFSETTTEPAL